MGDCKCTCVVNRENRRTGDGQTFSPTTMRWSARITTLLPSDHQESIKTKGTGQRIRRAAGWNI